MDGGGISADQAGGIPDSQRQGCQAGNRKPAGGDAGGDEKTAARTGIWAGACAGHRLPWVGIPNGNHRNFMV